MKKLTKEEFDVALGVLLEQQHDDLSDAYYERTLFKMCTFANVRKTIIHSKIRKIIRNIRAIKQLTEDHAEVNKDDER